MSDRQLSLTDVMNGMSRLSLNMRLSPPLFQFFWGLIMKANSLKPRFKGAFDLTVGQAIGIGGGNSRQAVWNKQQKLKKIKIDGQYLIKVTCGNKQKNVPATYDINYDLLVPLSLMIPEFDAHQSKIIDSSVDGSVDASIDRSVDHPKIREEEEEIPSVPLLTEKTTSNSDIAEEGGGSDSLDEEEDLRMIQKATKIQDLILRKWRSQIGRAPALGIVKQALREFGWDHKPLVQAINEAPAALTHPTAPSALNLVVGIARRIQGEGNGGVAKELLEAREREILQMKTDLEEARKKPEENEAYISQHEHILELKEASLESLRRE